MQSRNRTVNESILETDVNALADSFIRELALACRKVSIYGPGHPTAESAVEKPFFALEQLFQFKRLIGLNLYKSELYLLNIRLRDSIFIEELTRYLQILDISSLVIDDRVMMSELSRFIECFVRRVGSSEQGFPMQKHLDKYGIETIAINSDRGFGVFDSHRKYRGDSAMDCTVRAMAVSQLGDSIERLSLIHAGGASSLDQYNIDFAWEVIDYLLPELIANYDVTELSKYLCKELDDHKEIRSASGGASKPGDRLAAYWKLIEHHPNRQQILDHSEADSGSSELIGALAQEVGDEVTALKYESRDIIETMFEACFQEVRQSGIVEAFADAFQRIVRTGQVEQATGVIDRLTEQLRSVEGRTRGYALECLIGTMKALQFSTGHFVFEKLVANIVSDISSRRESYEYTELADALLRKLIKGKRYGLILQLGEAIGARRMTDGDVNTYDSVTIKKMVQGCNDPEQVHRLIEDMLNCDSEAANQIRQFFVATGEEEVATELSIIISHPIRSVRQQSLKVLGELGRSSLKVFSQILMDDAMFERESGRHELPDDRWYVIRNSIFVLGNLADCDAIIPLRLRINDPDVRVRREIIAALEKIGSEDACDLLGLMAQDSVREIRESAVITIGLIGTPDVTPLLINIVERMPSVASKAIHAIGKIGGEDAIVYLGKLLSDPEMIGMLSTSYASKDEIRISIVKALGMIGDIVSISHLQDYRNNMSVAKKLLFKNSPVNKTLSEILSGK